MKRLPLSQGQFALVDDEDYAQLHAHAWTAFYSPHTGTFFAKRKQSGRSVVLQRWLMKPKKRQRVICIDGNTLNCQRANLQVVSVSQMNARAHKRKTNRTGYKGVVAPNGRHRWRACIRVKGQRLTGGSFDTPEEAARAYDELAKKYFGEFARLNFPTESRGNHQC